jgi:putative addiction module component (TIGR02574 family)
MSAKEILEAAKALPQEERIKLAQEFWEIVAEEGYDPELTPEQLAELERRAAEARAHPERGTPWETVRAELYSRYNVKQ